MNKQVMLLIALGFVLPTAACICLPPIAPPGLQETATAIIGTIQEKATEVAATPALATPTAAPKPGVTVTPPVASPFAACFANTPEYPGAQRDRDAEANLEKLGQQLRQTMLPIGEGHVYVTGDLPGRVVEFYVKRMPERGWKQKVALTSDKGGIMLWEWEWYNAGILIGQPEEMQGKTVIIISCSRKEEKTPTPIRVTPRYYPGPDISPDGVELTAFSLEGPESPRVGDTLAVQFAFRNTKTSEMKFSPYGILVGCRDPENKNRDFGHKEVTLKPGESYRFRATIKVDKPGAWHFWPGYYLGHWGPYKWHEIIIEVKK